MTNLLVSLLAAATLHAAPTPASAGDHHLPAMAAQADPADSLWRAARRAVSDEDWDVAADAFRRLRSRFPKSTYIGDSYYWEAFALYQKGGRTALRDAVSLLDTQRDSWAASATYKSGESRSLATRIRGRLAQNGDEAAAASIAQSAAAAARATSATSRAEGRSTRGGRSAASGNCPDEDNDDRVAALNALLQMRSDDALPLLKQVLARRDACSEVLRRKAVFLVSQKRSTEAADILVGAAKNDPDQEVREQAVFWLGQVDDDRTVPILDDILKTSKDEAVQDKAIFSISQTRGAKGGQVLRDYALREDAPMHLREQAIFWIGQRKGENNSQFLRELLGRVKNEELQDKIVFAIAQDGSADAMNFLVAQATNKGNSLEIRKKALFWAGQSRQVDVAKLGAIYDRDDDREFKEQVIFVLSQRGRDAAAIDKLLDIAKTEKNRDLRQRAIFWLGQSHDPKAVKALQDLILRNPE